MNRLFLDANVLVSAALTEHGRVAALWSLSGVALCTSDYAVAEAQRNLRSEQHQVRLGNLLQHMEIVSGRAPWPEGVDLNVKDRPILQSAIYCHAMHLLTGDMKDFGHLFGRKIQGVLILWPREYWRRCDLEKLS